MLIPRGSYARLPESAAAAKGRRPLPAGDGDRGVPGAWPRCFARRGLRADPKFGAAYPRGLSEQVEKKTRMQRARSFVCGGGGGALGWPSADSGEENLRRSPKPVPGLWVRAEGGDRRFLVPAQGLCVGGRTSPAPTMSVGGSECDEGKGNTLGCLSSTYLGLCVAVGVTSGAPKDPCQHLCVLGTQRERLLQPALGLCM